jgi:hypothetical protein
MAGCAGDTGHRRIGFGRNYNNLLSETGNDIATDGPKAAQILDSSGRALDRGVPMLIDGLPKNTGATPARGLSARCYGFVRTRSSERVRNLTV